MRHTIKFAVLISIIGLMLPLVASSQQRVELEYVEGSFVENANTILIPGAYVGFRFKLTNLGSEGCAYEPSFVWQIYSTQGANWSNLSLDTLSNFGLNQFDQVIFNSWGITGSLADTVGLKFVAGQKSGLVDGYNDLTTLLGVETNSNWWGSNICIDTVYSHLSGFDWAWHGLDGCEDVIPEWGGPYCFDVEYPTETCVVGIEFESHPAQFSFSHCDIASYQFQMIDPCPQANWGVDDMLYRLVDGPGEVDSLTGLWSWSDIKITDVGQEYSVTVGVRKQFDLVYATTQMQIVVTNDAPQFTQGCGGYFFVGSGTEKVVEFDAADICQDDSISMFVVDGGGLIGPIWFDLFDLHYIRDVEDHGTYIITVGVTDGVNDGAYCEIEIINTACRGCGSCCGEYTEGLTGNIDFSSDGKRNLADITKLIDKVYISKNDLLCPEDGNVDGDQDGNVNLADITRLIDHVYISKGETASCP